MMKGSESVTFDEFLMSKEQIYDCRYPIIKAKYNEKLDFLYTPNFGTYTFDDNLKFVGIFDNEHQKLYGDSFYFNPKYADEIKTDLFAGNVSDIRKTLFEELDEMLYQYLIENEEKIISMSKPIFDKYILINNNYKLVKDRAIDNYIFSEEVIKPKFHIDSTMYKKDAKNTILKYIQTPKKILNELFGEYLNNEEKRRVIRYEDSIMELDEKAEMGLRLLEYRLEEKLTDEIGKNPTRLQKKKHDIYSAIENVDAQMLTISIEKEHEKFSFKYPKDKLCQFSISTWYIPDMPTRATVEYFYGKTGNWEEILIGDIKNVSYRGKALYEDKEMEHLKNIEQENEEELFD